MPYTLSIFQTNGRDFPREFETFEAAEYHLKNFSSPESLRLSPVLRHTEDLFGDAVTDIWIWDAANEVFIQVF